MSEEQHHDDAEHESGIKTPKQLITVIAASILVPVIVIIMLTQFVTLDNKKSPGSQALTASAVAARIAPVASDAVWESKVVERILHNLSLLLERSFVSVQELNRYRKEVTALVARVVPPVAPGPQAA